MTVTDGISLKRLIELRRATRWGAYAAAWCAQQNAAHLQSLIEEDVARRVVTFGAVQMFV